MNDDVERPQATLVVYRSLSLRRNQRWRWRLISNGHKLAHGGEGYAHQDEAERMGVRVCTGFYVDRLFDGGYEVYRTLSLTRSERWRWRLKVGRRILAVPGEGYANRGHADEIGRRIISGGYDVSVYRA